MHIFDLRALKPWLCQLTAHRHRACGLLERVPVSLLKTFVLSYYIALLPCDHLLLFGGCFTSDTFALCLDVRCAM